MRDYMEGIIQDTMQLETALVAVVSPLIPNEAVDKRTFILRLANACLHSTRYRLRLVSKCCARSSWVTLNVPAPRHGLSC